MTRALSSKTAHPAAARRPNPIWATQPKRVKARIPENTNGKTIFSTGTAGPAGPNEPAIPRPARRAPEAMSPLFFFLRRSPKIPAALRTSAAVPGYKLLSESLRHLRKACPGLKVVVVSQSGGAAE